MAATAFGPRGDMPGDVDDDVTLTMLSQRPMTFHDAEVEMKDRLRALGTAVEYAVAHDFPPECAGMLRNIVCRILSGVLGRPACLRGAYDDSVSSRCNGGCRVLLYRAFT